jgi:hypothetical protein
VRPTPVASPTPVPLRPPAQLSVGWQAGTDRRRRVVLFGAALLISLIFAVAVLEFQLVSLVGLLTWIAIGAIAVRPFIGLCVAFGLVMVFEAGGPDLAMAPGYYLHGGLGSTLGLNGAIVSPIELLLVLIFLVWLAQGAIRHRLDFRGGSLWKPMLAFFVALVAGLVRGMASGGDLNIALWESRFLFYTVITYIVAANTVRSRAQVRVLLWIALIGSTLFAIEGAYRRVELLDTGKLGVIIEFAYGHEDVIFLGGQILLVVAMFAFGAPFWMRVFGLLSVPIVGFTLLAMERRAGYIAVIVGILVLSVVFLMTKRKAFFLFSVPLIVGFAIYLPIFWNNTSLLGQPARAVKSLSQPDPRDASSNEYRAMELIDVQYTIKANPIFGVGFGRQFDFVVGLPDLSWWPFWHYEPHHNILWVWLKLGTIGFAVFWALMGTAIARAAYVVRTVALPEAKVFAIFALSAVVMTVVFCYVDLGLVQGRVTVLLGTAIGVLSVLHQLKDRPTIQVRT